MENPEEPQQFSNQEEKLEENADSGLEEVSEDDDDEDDEEEDWESDEDAEEDEEGDVNDGEEDDEDDDDDDDDDDEDAVLEASDSDGEAADRCPICLNRFTDQDIGTPEACDHVFCLECIQEWSTNVNTCPVDRQVFRLILCKHGVDDIIYKKITVEDTNKQEEVDVEEVEEEPTYCELCHQCDREDRLLLCDGCDLGYHLDCLTPPLDDVPVEEWFCPSCARREGVSAESDTDYVPRAASRYRRQIPRTLVMERVRSAIEERRVRRTRNIRRLLSSDEEEEDNEETTAPSTALVSPASSTSSPTKKSPAKKRSKRKTPRKYSRKKKRKTTKTTRKTKARKTTKTRTVSKTGKRKTKRKYRRKKRGKKYKKLARTAKPSAVTTVKTRIAGALGLTNPPPGRTIPMQKMKAEKSLDMKRTDIGAASLSIFGSRDEIIHFEDEQAEPASGSESAATRKYSRLALSSYKPIGRVPAILPVREKKKIVIKTSTGAAVGGVDLLGSIMQDQSKLHMSSKHVTIQRDGSLTTKSADGTKKTSVKPSDTSPGSQSLFKSSFTAVKSSPDKQTSVLSSLSGKGKSQSPEKISPDEAYDPAYPTDELEDDDTSEGDKNQTENEDVYDPAHPTDDISSDDEVLDNLEIGDIALPDSKQDNGTVKDSRSKKIEKVQIKKENKEIKEDKSNRNSSSIEVSKVASMPEKASANKHTSEVLKAKEKSLFCKTEPNKIKADTKSEVPQEKKDSHVSPKKTSTETAFANEQKTSVKLNTTVKSEKENTLKKSPSVKITETSKKSSIKPFEISRKTLFEKRRLYGGEIDFSEDVDFSEGAFPETFELNVKRIEEVFKGTKTKQEQEPKKDDTDLKMPDSQKVVIEKSDKVSSEDNKLQKSNSSKDMKEKSEKEKHDSHREGKIQEDKKIKSEKESKEKIKFTGKFKPISSDPEGNIGTTKISVSDRFKKISEERNTPEVASFEEEDPIHEMRKLDKELDLEFGNSDFSKKKEKDKETRKNKRKVSLDDNDGDYNRIKRESKENREKKKSESEYLFEEKEEGEVDEEYKLKERRKKDKKKRRDRDRYHDSDYKENADSDIDRRIVIQVSQNTEDRTVWEEAERQRKKRDREERKREKEKYSERDIRKERKNKRLRSRSRSHERRHRSRERKRSKSRSRERDRSRERARRKRRERSRSRSREWSYERSRKKKKRDRHRSRDRDVSREWSRDRSKERDWSREREWSSERGRGWSRGHSRDRKRSREHSDDKVDIFGRSRSPYTRRELLKDKQNLTPRKKMKTQLASDEVIEILDSTPPPKKPTYDEVSSSESEKEAGQEPITEKTESASKSKVKSDTEKIETISRIEVKESSTREAPSFADSDDKDDEFDDEPEETEQFQYTDRDEFLGQNKSKQMRQNLITIGVNSADYDPANPTETTSPAPPPLPEPISAPTPPLPPGGDFTQFPPPPPGPPPQGPPPGSVIIQEHPPIHVQASGPPGQGILGEGPIIIQGPPPPSLEAGPPPGIIQQRPAMSLPVNINVLPPGFHRGLPPTIAPQRQVIVSPMRPAAPRVQRLTSPGGVRFGWQVTTTSEVIPSQFGSRIPSPARLPGHPLINGPFDGLPPPQSEALPPQSLPPGHPQFPPPTVAPGEPHVIAIKTDTPPPNIVQIPVEVNEAQRHLPPPGPEPQLIHLGPDPRAPPPRLPIPLLPSTSEPPPMSVMVSIPPPNSSLMSIPPPSINVSEPFTRADTPPNSVSAILGLARMGTGSVPVVSSSMPPGIALSAPSVNGDSVVSSMNTNSDIHRKSEGTLNELEIISEMLNTQAQLMAVSKDRSNSDDSEHVNAGKSSVPVKVDVFKVPLVPTGKAGVKNEVDATEVVDMDMGSPINEEGNIELPVSPQFDNLIDNPEDLLEEDFNKKMQKLHEKDVKVEKDNDKVKEAKNKDVKNLDSKKDSPLKVKEDKHKHDKRSSKENKHDKHVHDKHEKSGHKSRKQKSKPDLEKDLKEKALKDAQFDLDSQEVPSSAVEMTNKEKYLKKLHLQERVVEEVKMAIKPFYSAKKITKDQYKDILRKAVPKICHSKSGNINPMKIKHLVEAYVEKFTKHSSAPSPLDTDNFSPRITTNGERDKITR